MATLAERAIRLNARGAKGGRRGGFALMTDRDRLADPRPLLDRLAPGMLVVLRHYGAPDRVALAEALARACRVRRLTLLIAGDFDLAVRLGAGLHLPEWRVRAAGPRIRLWHRRTRRQLTAAAHSRMALRRAAALGADLAFLSPVFATPSHAEARPLGTLGFRFLVRGAALPVWALGGVTTRTIGRFNGSGAAGVATVGGLLSPSPACGRGRDPPKTGE
jgi:thiamine-phosphate pyrophosphorylase